MCSPESNKPRKLPEALFLMTTAGLSFLVGFGFTLGRAKKSETKQTSGRLTELQVQSLQKQVKLHQEATRLGVRALAWGTFYAVSGVAIFSAVVWKMLGVNDLKEFRAKVGSFLPQITNPDSSVGRNEFNSLTDLIQYIIDEDNKGKNKGK